jgi:NAD-dependent deacetylase
MTRVAFLLGSGASVDSGLFTYRGLNSRKSETVYSTDSTSVVWTKLEPLIQRIQSVQSRGRTYDVIQEIVDLCETSVVLTQNIDGLARTLKNTTVVELHGNVNEVVCPNCGIVSQRVCCGQLRRPNVVLVGDSISGHHRVKTLMKRSYDYVLVIGTTLEFPYLRKTIGFVKGSGARVIHINPDPDYNRVEYVCTERMGCVFRKRHENVRRGETMITATASDGLRQFMELLQ